MNNELGGNYSLPRWGLFTAQNTTYNKNRLPQLAVENPVAAISETGIYVPNTEQARAV